MDNKTFTTALSKSLSLDSKETAAMTAALASVMTDVMSELDRVAIPSFGTFDPHKEDEKIVTRPDDGRRVLLPPAIVIGFTPATSLLK